MKVSITYTDESSPAFIAEFRIFATLSAYDPGCTYGPPENCYPPEGGELEQIDDIDLIRFESDYGETFEGMSPERVEEVIAVFRAELDQDEKLMDKISEMLFESAEPDYYERWDDDAI